MLPRYSTQMNVLCFLPLFSKTEKDIKVDDKNKNIMVTFLFFGKSILLRLHGKVIKYCIVQSSTSSNLARKEKSIDVTL